MTSLGRTQRYVLTGLVLAGLLAAALWLALLTFETLSTAGWNTWVNDVQIACQPGSDEQSVRTILGEPDDLRSPDDPVLGLVPPPPEDLPGAVRILVYSRSFAHGGYWAAHIYIGKDGSVITYHIGCS